MSRNTSRYLLTSSSYPFLANTKLSVSGSGLRGIWRSYFLIDSFVKEHEILKKEINSSFSKQFSTSMIQYKSYKKKSTLDHLPVKVRTDEEDLVQCSRRKFNSSSKWKVQLNFSKNSTGLFKSHNQQLNSGSDN